MKTIVLIFAATSLMGLAACKKSASCVDIAVIRYEGPVAGDGCDWTVTVAGIRYHPKTLDNAFKQDTLAVNLTWQLTGDTFFCGWGNQLPEIEMTCLEVK